jgi:hypothetical protein
LTSLEDLWPILNYDKAVLVAFGAEQQWVQQIAALIPDFVRVFSSRWVKLEIAADNLPG